MNTKTKLAGVTHRQRGLTMISIMILLLILGFFAFLAIRIGPIYMDYFSVSNALEGLKSEPGMAQQSTAKIRDTIIRRFTINSVDVVNHNEVKLRKDGANLIVSLKYEDRRPLAFNLDIVASFNKQVILVR